MPTVDVPQCALSCPIAAQAQTWNWLRRAVSKVIKWLTRTCTAQSYHSNSTPAPSALDQRPLTALTNSIGYVILSYTDWFCYLLYFHNLVFQPSLLNMVLPASALLYSMLGRYQNKLYWQNALLFVTFIIALKSCLEVRGSVTAAHAIARVSACVITRIAVHATAPATARGIGRIPVLSRLLPCKLRSLLVYMNHAYYHTYCHKGHHTYHHA